MDAKKCAICGGAAFTVGLIADHVCRDCDTPYRPPLVAGENLKSGLVYIKDGKVYQYPPKPDA